MGINQHTPHENWTRTRFGEYIHENGVWRIGVNAAGDHQLFHRARPVGMAKRTLADAIALAHRFRYMAANPTEE